MKLTKYLPRLNRKQKIRRNLLLVCLLLFVLWLVNDFSAPTLELAVKWKAEEYFLDQPEILGVFPREDGDDDVLLRDGDVFASTLRRRRFLCFQEALSFFFARPEEGPVVFLQQRDSFDVSAVYAYADLPDDTRAVCALHLRELVNSMVFDETYTMEGTPNENGLYRFALQRKYAENSDRNLETAEETTLWIFQCTGRGSGDPDFFCEVTITFYDADGNEVHIFERELWNYKKAE